MKQLIKFCIFFLKGLLTIVAFCMLTAAPHFLYGPGEDALALTAEFGALPDENATMEVLEEQRSKTLCRFRGGIECEDGEGNFAPQVVLFLAQFISGIGGSLYYTLGVSYMDDNIKKSKTPVLLSKLHLLFFFCFIEILIFFYGWHIYLHKVASRTRDCYRCHKIDAVYGGLLKADKINKI